MLRFSLTIALTLLLLFTPGVQAVMITFLTDEVDDSDTVQSVCEKGDVKDLRKQMDDLRGRLYRLKERDFEDLFGKPADRPAKAFALPVGEPRMLVLSGLRHANPRENKDHTDFYKVGGFAGIEVYYHVDGVTPQVILFYLRVDGEFPRLTKENLAKRLAWERLRIRKLSRFFEERRRKVFVWEVDTEAEKKLYQGDFSRDPKAKLESWLATGKKLGYRLEVERHANEGSRYDWYRPDGSLARRVYSNYGEQLPGDFTWYHEGGRREYRREFYSRGRIDSWRWEWPDSGSNLRCERADAKGRPISWGWADRDYKSIHCEWDDNGDGIPDLFMEAKTGKAVHRLRLEQSWAVHPELIPKGSRIPDQPERRVPLRKIPSLEPEREAH